MKEINRNDRDPMAIIKEESFDGMSPQIMENLGWYGFGISVAF